MQGIQWMKRAWIVVVVGCFLTLEAWAADPNLSPRPKNTPDGTLVVLDVAAVRVLGAAVTLAGGALFVVTLPVTAFAGVETAWNALVADPFYFTFLRPVGEFDDWRHRASLASEPLPEAETAPVSAMK